MEIETIRKEDILEKEGNLKNEIRLWKIMQNLLNYFEIFENKDKIINKNIEKYANEYFKNNNIGASATFINADSKYGTGEYIDRKLYIKLDEKNIGQNIKILDGWDDTTKKKMPFYKDLIYKNEWLEEEHLKNYEKENLDNIEYTLQNYERYNKLVNEVIEMKYKFMR